MIGLIVLQNNETVFISKINSENKIYNRLYFVSSKKVMLIECSVELTVKKLTTISKLVS